MHQESTDEFNSGNGEFFPLTFFTIISHIVCNSIFVHTDDAVITDSDSMCVLTKIVNNRLGTIEGFLAVRDPVFFIAGVKKLFEGIVVEIFYTATMKLKFIFFPSNTSSRRLSIHISFGKA